MPNESPLDTSFDFDLLEQGGVIHLDSFAELSKWNHDEYDRWKWLGNESARQVSQNLFPQHISAFNDINEVYNQWAQQPKNPQYVETARQRIATILQNYYRKGRILYSGNVAAQFIIQLKDTRGEIVAAGAYCMVLAVPFQFRDPLNPSIIEGNIEGFLFRRNIDWSAAVHQESLNKLKSEYESNLVKQKVRLEEIQLKNDSLNTLFNTTLEDKTKELTKLRDSHSQAHEGNLEASVKKLTSIEETFYRKLALQTPVKYWADKELFHRAKAKTCSFVSAIAGTLLIAVLGVLVYLVLGHLAKDENPQHWQIGILLIALFFAVWLLRILVRLYLSHQHLATDAAERKIIIQTYISLTREGPEFQPDDKRLILQHIFREASDGLVKDDATPKTPLEVITRNL